MKKFLLILFACVFSKFSKSDVLTFNQYFDSTEISKSIKLGRDIFDSDPDLAFRYLKKSENSIVSILIKQKLTGQKPDNSLLRKLALIYTDQGRYYRNKGNPKEALNLCYKSLEILQLVNDYFIEALNYNNMGIIFQRNLNDDSKAIEMIEKAIQLLEQNNDKKSTLTMYANLGYIYEKINKKDLSYKNYHKCLSYIPLSNDTAAISYCYYRLGTIHLNEKNLDSADFYLKKSLYLRIKSNNIRGSSVSFYSLSKLSLLQNKFVDAEQYAVASLDKAKSIYFPSDIMNAYEILADVYERKSNWKESAMYRKKYSFLKDSLSNIELRDQLLRNQYSYEYKLKSVEDSLKYVNKNKERELTIEKQKEIIKVNSILKIVYVVLFILLISIIFMLYRRLIYKKTKKELELQLKIIETEQNLKRALMNPHFLFNSLNSIQNLIIRNENKIARNYIVKISKLMRLILEQSEKQLISLDEELRTIQLYFEMEQLRFKDKFNYYINVDDEIQKDQYEIPALIIQPFIENAIIHGIQNIEGRNGIIKINIKLRNDYLLCEVTDNGVGLNNKPEYDKLLKKTKSFGIQSVRERLKNIKSNIIIDTHVEVYEDIDYNQQVVGTTAKIKIPYNKIK